MLKNCRKVKWKRLWILHKLVRFGCSEKLQFNFPNYNFSFKTAFSEILLSKTPPF